MVEREFFLSLLCPPPSRIRSKGVAVEDASSPSVAGALSAFQPPATTSLHLVSLPTSKSLKTYPPSSHLGDPSALSPRILRVRRPTLTFLPRHTPQLHSSTSISDPLPRSPPHPPVLFRCLLPPSIVSSVLSSFPVTDPYLCWLRHPASMPLLILLPHTSILPLCYPPAFVTLSVPVIYDRRSSTEPTPAADLHTNSISPAFPRHLPAFLLSAAPTLLRISSFSLSPTTPKFLLTHLLHPFFLTVTPSQSRTDTFPSLFYSLFPKHSDLHSPSVLNFWLRHRAT